MCGEEEEEDRVSRSEVRKGAHSSTLFPLFPEKAKHEAGERERAPAILVCVLVEKVHACWEAVECVYSSGTTYT